LTGTDETYIESRLPLEQISIECSREGSAAIHPPVNRLHVWWARRPLIASRAAILGALLPSAESDDEFLKLLGIKGDPQAALRKIQEATGTGTRIVDPFGYKRAYTHIIEPSQHEHLEEIYKQRFGSSNPIVVDPMAGGGSIPFEALRAGVSVVAGEYNPVGHVILKATIEYPARFGTSLTKEITRWCKWINSEARRDLGQFYDRSENEHVLAYIWARTVRCPSCHLAIPLSPNWWLSRRKGEKRRTAAGLRVPARGKGDEVTFEIVDVTKQAALDPNKGTVQGGRASCPRQGCGNTVPEDYLKKEAQEGRMGHQLYAIFTKRKLGPSKWEKVFRLPSQGDIRAYEKAVHLVEKGEFPGYALVPREQRFKGPADRSVAYGVTHWDKAFNPRQLVTHATYLQYVLEAKKKIFQEVGASDRERAKAITTYLALVFDKCTDRDSILTRFGDTRLIIVNTFDRHDFGFSWSYGEMPIPDLGFEWAVDQVVDAYEGLCQLLNGVDPSRAEVCLGSATQISYVKTLVDAVVVDPPYYANVMYSELSDFFYVWMKRILGDLYPGFDTPLTDKDGEVVANVARFKGLGASAEEKAKEDYRMKMAQTFKQIHRILKANAVLVVMFTHRTTQAWDTLATALIDAGFQIKRSWPVRTESEHSLHIARKNAVKSTIFLVARKRLADTTRGWWEQEVYPEIEKVAQAKTVEFEQRNISGVDLYISTFGPVLEVFSRYPEVKSMTGKTIHPEEALDVARKVVTNRTLEKLVPGGGTGIDETTKFYILAIHFYHARQFPFDEARKLAISVGIDPTVLREKQHVITKKSEDVIVLDSAEREHSGYIDLERPADKPLIDAIHLSELAIQRGGMKLYQSLIDRLNLDTNPDFRVAIRALSQALPDADPEKKALTPLLVETPELRTKGSRLEDYSTLAG
jgi:putative DNA methylase